MKAAEPVVLGSNGASRSDSDEENGIDNESDGPDNLSSDDVISAEDFDGFETDDGLESDEPEVKPQKKQRENPYVPPIANGTTPATKYIPPSLRKPAESDEEVLKQLRKQVQGLLNKLSESNMPSILQSLEELYSKNARQHVTSTLVDLLVALISDASVLNDTFLILHAGFSAAVYKIVGTEFGAQLLEKIVKNFDRFRNSSRAEGKQTLNLLGFLSCLYTFQVIGSPIMFDYVRLLLEEISEANTELLVRIIRTSGQQLRQEDPSALKDIVLLLQRNVAKTGEDNLSVRTKFMIETINDLKNNRMKAGIAASTVSSEHTTRMKKTLGSLTSSKSVRPTEALQITLADIRDSEKKGKWWSVGASYRDQSQLADDDNKSHATRKGKEELDAGYESETPGSVNLHKLARTQGMNTDVRRAIFIAVLSSADYQEAHTRILKLHLKSKQLLELPRVLVHCAGAEQSYNPFYALVARKFCSEHRLRKAFQFTLWDAFRQMEALQDGEEEEHEGMSVRKIVNLAKFYGMLVADRGLSIAALKKLEFAYMQPNVGMFVEVLLTTVFTHVRKKVASELGFEHEVREMFLQATGATNILQGLRYFVETTVSKAALAKGKKERKAVESGCSVAVEALDEASKAAPIAEDDGEESEDL